jgi:hypothetical protein
MTAGYRNKLVAPSITGPATYGYCSEKPDAVPLSGTWCAPTGMLRTRGPPLRRELDDLGEPSGLLRHWRVADNVQLRAHPDWSRLLD